MGWCQAEKAGIPTEVKRYFILPEDIRQDYPENIYISYGSTPDDAWEKIRLEAEHQGLIKRRKIGNADCMLFKAKPVVEIYEHALRTDPLSLFGIKNE